MKLNFFQCLDIIALKILSPKMWINKNFSWLFFINLGTQFGCPNWFPVVENPLDTPLVDLKSSSS